MSTTGPLPSAPDPAFGSRIITAAFTGATLGAASGVLLDGIILMMIGNLDGSTLRAKLFAAFPNGSPRRLSRMRLQSLPA